MSYIKPAALKPGDTIGIVAPASNIKAEMLEEGCRELERLGFRTRVPEGMGSSYRYFSAPDERRLTDLVQMIQDPDVHAIFAARGGYGAGRLLPHLSAELFRANPKVICGSSDLTILLNFVQRSGVVAFHGPMVATSFRLGEAAYHRPVFEHLLMGRDAVEFPTGGCSVLRPGSGEGILAGGCLSLVVATLGTRHEIDTKGALLVMEDIDTKPYQIDRMLTHMKQAGKFADVRGVVFGEMLNCAQNANQGYTLEEVLLDVLGEFKFPILYGFPTGHTSRPHVIVPFGVRARLDLGASMMFETAESAVLTK